MKNVFRIAANRISAWTGTASVFLGAVLVIVVWAFTGPAFHYSDTWQLVINTGTTIVTFLMVFLIQNTQNRDSKAVQLKLDELIRTTKGARNSFAGLEDLTDDEIQQLDKEFKLMGQNPSTLRALSKIRDQIAEEKAHRSGMAATASRMLQHTLTIAEPVTTLVDNRPVDHHKK